LKAATLRPRARIAPISATVAVVLPAPLAVAAMTTRGILPERTIASAHATTQQERRYRRPRAGKCADADRENRVRIPFS